MTRIALTLVLLLLCACGDTVESHYATRAAANADSLFGRGWLPDFIPESASDIRVANNLDLSTSSGGFRFKAADWPAFENRLVADGLPATPFANRDDTVARYQSMGYRRWTYTADGTTWVFFCEPRKGRCEYLMWERRPFP